MSLKEQIDIERLPKHIAVIMDGNGRWAKERGKPRIFGHQSAIKSVREINEACAELGVSYLTLYAFSTENWNRPTDEVKGLMTLLGQTMRNEASTLIKNSIRLQVTGDVEKMPVETVKLINETIERTKGGSRMVLNLALSYSGRWEITEAARKIAQEAKAGTLDPETITEDSIAAHLATAGMPDPELLIRTGGELRLSNYLLWQSAYTELYFCDTFWPDFNMEELCKAIYVYQQRERRFGLTGGCTDG